MGKKIALFAPHTGANYGTLLQSFSLAEAIKNEGYECEYISYSPYYKKSLLEKLFRRIKSVFPNRQMMQPSTDLVDDYSFWYTPDFEMIRLSASDFADKRIPYSSVHYNPKNLRRCIKYERYIVGSDQTWSMERFLNEGPVYFLYFLPKGAKKYSYAPSLGTLQLTERHQKILRRYLKTFSLLSCREKANCDKLGGMIKKKVEYVADPTLLFDGAFWRRFSSKIDMPDKFVLAYVLGEKDIISEFSESLGRLYDIPVYYVLTRPKYLSKPLVLKDLSVEQWVYVIDHASFIVTDSFHGTLFSINLNKQFYSFAKRENVRNDYNDNDRVLDLLDSLKLSSRFIDDDYDKNSIPIEMIDYAELNSTIDSFRSKSLSYLNRILNS